MATVVRIPLQEGLVAPWTDWQRRCPDGRRLLEAGTYALTEGAIAAGCRVFAGYPITPATDIAEYMSKRLPQVGGYYMQCEDELAGMHAGTVVIGRIDSVELGGRHVLAELGAQADVIVDAPGRGNSGIAGCRGGVHRSLTGCRVRASVAQTQRPQVVHVLLHAADGGLGDG